MALTPHEKEIAGTWKERMAAAAAAFGLGAVLPPPVGPLCGALAAGTGASAYLASRYEGDPPDFDATRPTSLRPGPNPAPLLKREIEPHPATIDVVESLRSVNAALSAALRAYERAQGAWILGDETALEARRSEAQEFARTSSEDLLTLAERFETFAEFLPRTVGPENVGISGRAPRRPSDLPEATLAFLYRAGVPISELARALQAASEDREELSRATLQAVSPASRELSEALLEWDPTPQGGTQS